MLLNLSELTHLGLEASTYKHQIFQSQRKSSKETNEQIDFSIFSTNLYTSFIADNKTFSGKNFPTL